MAGTSTTTDSRSLRTKQGEWEGKSHGTSLGLAGFGRVMGLQVLDDFLGVFLWNPRAVGLVHFVHFGFPGRGGKRRLHGDVARAVAGVAIDLNVLAAVAWGKFQSRHRVGWNLVFRIRRKGGRSGLPDAPKLVGRV